MDHNDSIDIYADTGGHNAHVGQPHQVSSPL
ncbi:hypothetical protein JOD27_003454 [Lentzea nigeriaca]|nr:hypothetical protein [Lentzea nigeriaca]